MSILTGLFSPSKGTAIINGFNIRKEIESVRSSLGICPQFDVLFDELTVEEHLMFYCKLKNVTDQNIVKEETTRMIELLGLEDKRKSQAQTLSGGMKRKLSVKFY
jgi:ATP-binding cassette subfamily A (ABC1) protein 3